VIILRNVPGAGVLVDGEHTIVDAHGWELAVTEGRDGGARFEIQTGL
jgi:hypothetical protein